MSDSIVLYDFLLVKGGAEAVTIELHEKINDLDLGVGFVNEKNIELNQLDTSKIFTLTSCTQIKGWQILKSALSFYYSSNWLKKYKQIVFSGTCAPLAVRNVENSAKKIMYTHTPPRFIYDLREYYFTQSSFLIKILIKLLIAFIQPRYEDSCDKMDLIIANSKNVKNRIKKYLGKEAIVIYPPSDISSFHWIRQDDFYLSTARVENYKRVDLIIKAFINLPDKKLVVASGGADLADLKKIAKNATNIEFTGWCSDTKIRELIGRCIATIYIPLDEDFGMSPVESMAAEKPVIGVDEGGVKETVIHEETGILCPANPTENDIIAAVNALPPQRAFAMREKCRRQAKSFSSDIFIEKMTRLLSCEKTCIANVAREVDASSIESKVV